MNISPFKQLDSPRLLEIFLSNQGKYFDESEITMFTNFLENNELTQEFYTIAEKERIIGCGGFERTAPKQFDLTWGMVDSEHHRKGYGKALLEYRLKRIREQHGDVTIRVETSQHTSGFFERNGFTTQETKIDGFGQGIDYVLMTRMVEPVAKT